MGRTPHEVSGLRKAGDHPARRALPFAGAPHPGETRHSQGDFLSLWTALPLQVDFEKDPLWFVANIYPASPGGIGAPKWGIRSRTPLQLVGLEGLDKNQALCAPVRLCVSFLRRLANSGQAFRKQRGTVRPFEARPK